MNKPLFDDTNEAGDKEKEEPEEEVKELMENHDLDQDEAEEVKELMDETGLNDPDRGASTHIWNEPQKSIILLTYGNS
ncbi:MAG: hypothetical protein A3I89_01445 [Candidatus Harrisonbacteria bacterium RIFCSPLOWO2_02_FULL_41_11]|uniref:Uncharacterized protein n=1 Tax=Candidatus Harrisonbacteria bacterium RIFCSPHIGHO2_02_FULL_42_16 TaxID=1798404 RepID=A0A1G1ZFD8_9BACT|nr:MAG: hypothetical protein A3B92_04045 [Candidatus Harrisonbacteria bacterium RIFCSPHIGHO2_02_FULL_42_16]OGY66720.1 MAG: hypothetical protein A3I89_01445 [Candidatus Harrisonbacteria bacterium RIFCSPLOWO2_02_FULL_41_11]